MPTFLEWDQAVLERVGGLAVYVSLHRYVGNPDDNKQGDVLKLVIDGPEYESRHGNVPYRIVRPSSIEVKSD